MEAEEEGERSAAHTPAEISPELEKRLRVQVERTHHFLRVTGLPAVPPPHLPPSGPSQGQDLLLCPRNMLPFAPGSPSLAWPVSPILRCGLPADKTRVPPAGLAQARLHRCRLPKPPAPASPHPPLPRVAPLHLPPGAPPPPAGLSLTSRHLGV